MRHTLGKNERLKSRKSIEALFRSGAWLAEGPVKMVFLFTQLNTKYPARMAVSVPKSKVKRAVDRNRIKRQIREAYRLNKAGLYKHLIEREYQCTLMFVYQGATTVESVSVEKRICKLLQRLLKEDA